MKKSLPFLRNFIILILCATNGRGDEIDLEVESGLKIKMLRDMGNQTAAESLNLPANASSIRENITDTFSCENRTYGYYADVDNDCQIFHVCLPSQTASGRNVTYKWSFICPNETIFNQEVLVCTRPEDAIDCKDSPMYYDLNKDIGKEPNKTRNVANTIEINEKEEVTPLKDSKKEDNPKKTEQVFPSRNPIKRKPVKQNYIVQQLIKDIVDEEMREKLQNIDFTDDIEQVFPVVSGASEKEPEEIENRDRIVITDEMINANEKVFNDKVEANDKEDLDEREDDRLILERSMGRNLKRGTFRFMADI